MALVALNQGERTILKLMLGQLAAGTFQLRLYTNNFTPAETSVNGDVTECAVAGYSALALATTGWTVSTVTDTSAAFFAQQTFTFSTSTTIYGYHYTHPSDSGNVLIAEKFASAFTFGDGGGKLEFVPRIELN